MTLERYMQPIAIHRGYDERLLLQDTEGHCYLWVGEPGEDPVDISLTLAHYLMHRPEVSILAPHQRLWFCLDDLPVRADVAAANPELPEREYFR